MNISIGMTLRDGPFGGGNQFARALVADLQQRGHQVTFDLNARDLDIILLMDPRQQSQSATYQDEAIWHYVRYINPNAIVIHRINECDERKGTEGVNARIIEANACADYTVYVSGWLRDLYRSQGIGNRPAQVIHNGSDRAIFNAGGYTVWDGQSPLKLVTHHWSHHWRKGFDIYQALDALLNDPTNRTLFDFTYIGNIPPDFTFKHAHHIEPLSGHELADAIRQHHVYITASLNEPGPNHQNEAANCGLPLLYRPSGGLTEYCEGYGIAFTADTLLEVIREMRQTYTTWRERIAAYPYHAQATTSAYHDLFAELVAHRDDIIAKRTWQPAPAWQRQLHRLKQRVLP